MKSPTFPDYFPETSHIKEFLDEKVGEYNHPDFIENDPVSIPHGYSKLQDIEITGFWTAMLAWGQRKTIINKANELFDMMDHDPHNFVMNHKKSDLKSFLDFRHRTFNGDDTLYFIRFFKNYYQRHHSLEDAFVHKSTSEMRLILSSFHNLFFEDPMHLPRTRKHIATPERKSACKRINMFLRWMVRKDDKGVDFGLWNQLDPAVLICPCDLHVGRVARKLGLITRHQNDWQTALELTARLRSFNPADPVQYDFALFGLGVEERF